MKVILLQDVARIGRRFEVKDVPDGHALNFLIPRKLAEPATGEALKRIEERKAKATERSVHADEDFAELLKKLEGRTVKLAVEANEKGHLFKSVKAEDIATAVTVEVAALAASDVVLSHPIKEVGVHSVSLSHGTLSGSVSLEVVAK